MDYRITKTPIVDQPAPKPTAGVPIWDLVMADMAARDRVGRERYGVPLQSGNGRDALVDAYQEALDLTAYLRQAIEERGGASPTFPGELWQDETGRLWTYRGTDAAALPSQLSATSSTTCRGPFRGTSHGGVPCFFFVDAGDEAIAVQQGFDWRGPIIPHRAAMAAELARLRAREQELLECNTRLVEANRR